MTDRIETERLVLRPPVPGDAPVLMAAFNDWDVVKWLARVPYPFTQADLRLENGDGSSRWPALAAIDKDGEMIGMISGADHLGFWLKPEFWGQGYASEAAQAMARFVFETQSRDTIRSGYFEGNLAAARVMEKLGFREIGRGTIECISRRCEVAIVNLALTRAAWEAHA